MHGNKPPNGYAYTHCWRAEAPHNGSMTSPDQQPADYWDDRYRTIGAQSVSWFEPTPDASLGLFELAQVTPSDSVIDIGGGASALTAALQERGHQDLTILDLSHTALNLGARQANRPGAIRLIQANLLSWSPDRQWDVWHDRAVFHFLTQPDERATYRRILDQAIRPHGVVAIATFATNGPTACSGLAVCRYAADELLAELGDDFDEIAHRAFDHITPSGAVQPFTAVVARRRGART